MLRVGEYRARHGLSYRALAAEAGVTVSQIQRFESDPDANPTLATLRRLAEALDCTVCELIGETHKKGVKRG